MSNKFKWQVKYWSDDKDCEVTKGFDTYEEAMTFKHKIERKINRRAWVSLK